ncbi:MAG: PEP/pyruvate-binding domain-containing protein [Sandaracinaceae bacterium]|nr:PEP/pyruvate-binding domain-containing protein [Sandaracinaceae bacterium]
MHPDVRFLEQIAPSLAPLFGWKATRIALLCRKGIPTPPGFVISHRVAKAVFRNALHPSEQPEVLVRGPRSMLSPERLESIALKVRRADLPHELVCAVRGACAAIPRGRAFGWAVRASPIEANARERLFSGMYRTLVDVQEEEALFDAIREVWASTFSSMLLLSFRALLNRGRFPKIGVAVLVQPMVRAEAFGVVFTANPLTWNGDEVMINALRKPSLEGETWNGYRINKDNHLGATSGFGVIGKDGHIVMRGEARDEGGGENEVLDKEMLRRLFFLARRIEAVQGEACDIEWAIEGNQIQVLDLRPVAMIPTNRISWMHHGWKTTTWKPQEGKILVELFPEGATPLTWSVLGRRMRQWVKQGFGGIDLFETWADGLYFNLSAFVDLISQHPFFTQEAMWELVGIPRGGRNLHLLRETLLEEKGSWLRLPLALLDAFRQLLELKPRLLRFERAFAKEQARLLALDWRLLSGIGLSQILADLERELDRVGRMLFEVEWHLCLFWFFVYKLLVFGVGSDEAAPMAQALLGGMGGLESAKPALELARIARVAKADWPSFKHFAEPAGSELDWKALPHGPTRALLERLLRLHGARGVRETEIEAPRWQEEPAVLIAVLKKLLVGEGLDLEAIGRKQRLLREHAERSLALRLPWGIRQFAKEALSWFRRLLRNRDRLYGQMVWVLGGFRRLALEVSRRMQILEPTAGQDAVFFLAVEELHAFLRGEIGGISDIVARRRFHRRIEASLHSRFGQLPGKFSLRGCPLVRGKAKGRVRVLTSLQSALSLEPGEVVVAPKIDVGWTPLFLLAAAIITECGGIFSPGAIVARELGVPFVSGIEGVTQRLRTGMVVMVDGESGAVHLLEDAESSFSHG